MRVMRSRSRIGLLQEKEKSKQRQNRKCCIYAHRKSSDTYVKVLSKIKDIYGSTETTDKSIKAKRVLLFLG